MAPIYDPQKLAGIEKDRAAKSARQQMMKGACPEQMTTMLYNLPPALGAAAVNLLSGLTSSFIKRAPGAPAPVSRYSYGIATKTSDDLYTVDFVHEASGTGQDQMIRHENAGVGVNAQKAVQLLQQYETQLVGRRLPYSQSDFDDTDYKKSSIFAELQAAGKARNPVRDAGPDYMRPKDPIVF